ncbi:MAG: S8 family serine peptidase [Candidatus Kapaibacterium sp.]
MDIRKYASALLLLFFALLISNIASADNYRVFFKDKGPEAFVPGSALYESTFEIISKRSLERRAKILTSDSLISYEDAPLYKPYLDSLTALGTDIKLKLRWKNYAVIEAPDSIRGRIDSLDFVYKTQNTSAIFSSAVFSNGEGFAKNNILSENECDSSIDYGSSLFQLERINVTEAHKYGFTGIGVLAGFIDTGFETAHPSLDHLNVAAAYDFINNDGIVSNEPDDEPMQISHGTAVLSCTAGLDNGRLIGSAPGVDIALARTEEYFNESRIEEDRVCAALEWMEALGADIVNISLGYLDFPGEEDYKLSDFTGDFALSAKYLNIAAQKNMLCVVSAGNMGPLPSSVSPPGTADSALTVGALDSLGRNFANFSSRGPLANGKLKPEIFAPGTYIKVANPYNGNYYMNNGTSLAAPIITGGAALLLEAFPEITAFEIKNAIRSSADISFPDDITQIYGVPDMIKAISGCGIAVSPGFVINKDSISRLFFRVLKPDSLIWPDIKISFGYNPEIIIYDDMLRQFADTDIYFIDFENLLHDSVFYDLQIRSGDYTRTVTGRKQNLKRNYISCAMDKSILPLYFPERDKPVVYPSVVASRDEPYLTLSYSVDKEGDVKIEIYNSAGKLIRKRNLSNQLPGAGYTVIETAGLASGVYFVKIGSDNKTGLSTFMISR